MAAKKLKPPVPAPAKPARTPSQRGRLSRNKGKAFERLVAQWIREVMPGADVKRGFQSRSGRDGADVECPVYWPECKVGAKPPVLPALRQAIEASAGTGRIPVAVCKVDRGEVTVTMRAGDWLEMVGKLWRGEG